MMVRITYADGSRREVELADVTFGDEEVNVRGPILFATPIAARDRDDDYLPTNRLSRSMSQPA